MQLQKLGWGESFAARFTEITVREHIAGAMPLRIIRENREQYVALGEQGEFRCEVSGKFRYTHMEQSSYPAVGDWVVATGDADAGHAVIHALLDRFSAFSRKVPGEVTEEQIIAANIDTLFIVTGLDENFNIRRIERYITLAWDSGAVPVLILNKADLCPDVAGRLEQVEEVACGAEIAVISAVEGEGIDTLDSYITAGRTVAFVGSSGVGKSTIINTLLGSARLAVNTVSGSNSKGRHTTTHRELILLPEGGMVIDTPGMREIQLWGDEEGLRQSFDDIEMIAADCRFSDCRHESEPGCAVKAAIESGELDEGRFASYLKLRKEYAHLARRQSVKAMKEERAKWKEIAKMGRSVIKIKRGEL